MKAPELEKYQKKRDAMAWPKEENHDGRKTDPGSLADGSPS